MYSLSFLLLYDVKYASIKYIFDKIWNLKSCECHAAEVEEGYDYFERSWSFFAAIQRNIRTSWKSSRAGMRMHAKKTWKVEIEIRKEIIWNYAILVSSVLSNHLPLSWSWLNLHGLVQRVWRSWVLHSWSRRPNKVQTEWPDGVMRQWLCQMRLCSVHKCMLACLQRQMTLFMKTIKILFQCAFI